MDHPRVGVIGTAAGEIEDIREILATEFADGAPELVVEGEDGDRASVIECSQVVLTFSIDEEDLRSADSLEWVQALNAGVDSYPVDTLQDRAVVLTNSSGVHAEPIGQQVLGYMLIFERRIHVGIAQQRAGEWDRYGGGELGDRTLGVIGVGAIGSRVAELGQALGMRVIGTKRDPDGAPDVLDACYGPEGLDAVLAESEYLVIACPLTEETRGMIGPSAFETLPDDAVLVNIARGEIVDETALIEAVEGGVIRGAALDVFETEPLPEDSPLRSLQNVVTTPHMAGSSPHYFDRALTIFAENYAKFLDGDTNTMRNRIC